MSVPIPFPAGQPAPPLDYWTLVAVGGAYVLFLALLAAFILLPSVVLGRARQSFRRRMQTDPGLRTAVEGDLATWRDPYGTAGYGPL